MFVENSENVAVEKSRIIKNYLDLPKGNLYYEEHGSGQEVIIYINGFASGISSWYPVIKPLKKHYRNILFDYIGTGLSKNNDDHEFSFDQYCSELDALMDNYGDSKIHLVGYSMGGWVAQEFVTRYPQRVESLVLINTSSCISARQNWIINHFISVLNTGDISAFSQLMFISYYSPEYFEKHRDHLVRIRNLANATFEKQDLGNWEDLLASCLQFNAESLLPTLDMPVLSLSGEHDLLCPRMTADRIQELIPNLESHEISGVGHAIPMEEHGKLSSYLSDFMNENRC